MSAFHPPRPRVGDVAEDATEGVQGMPAARERLGRHLELAHGEVVQGGEGLVQVLVHRIAHSSTPLSRLRFAGESSAFASSARTSRSSRASLPFA